MQFSILLSSLYCLCLLHHILAVLAEEEPDFFSQPYSYNHRFQAKVVKFKRWHSEVAEGSIIEFSHEPNGYKVSIELGKDNCDIAQGPDKLSRDDLFNSSDLVQLDEQGLGPDEIIVQFEGASVQAQVARTMDFCKSYFAIFQVPLSGSYRLKVIRLRRDYLASREGLFYPEIDYELLLDTNIDNKLEFYAPKPCSQAIQGYWVTTRMHHVVVESMKIKDTCRGGMSRGLPLTTNILMHDEMHDNFCASDVQNFGWSRKICRANTFSYKNHALGEVVAHKHPNITSSRPYEYFKRRKLLFVGDHHIKGLSELFLEHICHYDVRNVEWNKTFIRLTEVDGSQSRVPYIKVYFSQDEYDEFREPIDNCRDREKDIDQCPYYQETVDELLKKRIEGCFVDPKSRDCDLFDQDCAGSSVTYIDASYCEEDLSRYMDGYDFVVMNCGNIMSKDSKVPYWLYRNIVHKLAESIVGDKLPKDTNFFYVENTAIPLHQNGVSKQEMDKRTYHRLIMFDAIAKHELVTAGLNTWTVPAFHSTLALFDKFCDCSFYPWSAKMPQLLALTDQMRRSVRNERRR